MPKVTFIEYNGTEHKVSVEDGMTMMNAAVENFVPGIDGDCGGACACGTCHVIVDSEWIPKIPPSSKVEQSMLRLTPEVEEGSRLACQIEIGNELDGLVVRLPEFQM